MGLILQTSYVSCQASFESPFPEIFFVLFVFFCHSSLWLGCYGGPGDVPGRHRSWVAARFENFSSPVSLKLCFNSADSSPAPAFTCSVLISACLVLVSFWLGWRIWLLIMGVDDWWYSYFPSPVSFLCVCNRIWFQFLLCFPFSLFSSHKLQNVSS